MRNRSRFAVLLAVLVLAGGVAVAAAQKGKKEHGNHKVRETGPSVTHAVITREERVVVNNYFVADRGLPPGLAKREHLPPGLEKQLRTRGTLPPGLAKKMVRLPVELERQLHPIPAGYCRFMIGGHIVLVNKKTNVVLDAMFNVIR